MSHLTANDIRSIGQIIDAAIMFLNMTGQREPALMLVLEGIRFFLPTIAGLVEISDLENCSKRYYEEGKLTLVEYQKIQQLLPPSR